MRPTCPVVSAQYSAVLMMVQACTIADWLSLPSFDLLSGLKWEDMWGKRLSRLVTVGYARDCLQPERRMCHRPP